MRCSLLPQSKRPHGPSPATLSSGTGSARLCPLHPVAPRLLRHHQRCAGAPGASFGARLLRRMTATRRANPSHQTPALGPDPTPGCCQPHSAGAGCSEAPREQGLVQGPAGDSLSPPPGHEPAFLSLYRERSWWPGCLYNNNRRT